MKKLVNHPSDVVREMLEGVALLNSALALLEDENVIVRRDSLESKDRRVAILSGGGSGHEPAHAGYVGRGMLTAAVAGDVFTSPSTDTVLAAIRAVSGKAGALLIVKNYTGDRLNFGLAAEIARAEGIPVEMVLVADDVALRETVADDRRRGIAGTVFVHKVAGAAAEQGLPLAEVARIARKAAASVASMGVSLGACTLPAVGKPGFELGHDEIEVGLGIHGEKGVARQSMATADELCRLILDVIARDRPFAKGGKVALLVNGLGATPPIELSILARGAVRALQEMDVIVARAWSGTFLSALDMPGFSLSVLPLDEELTGLLDRPTEASAWPGGGMVNNNPFHKSGKDTDDISTVSTPPSAHGLDVYEAVRRAARALIAAEAELTELDSIAGDGDLGASMKRGAEAILALPSSAFATPATGLTAVGNELRKVIGGSSGPFFATAILRAARHLADIASPSAKDWASAFILANEAISELGGARAGDRTMLDALYPAADMATKLVEQDLPFKDLMAAIGNAAAEGANATKSMVPRQGRASYLAERAIGHPDGGAVACAIWLKALA